MLEKPTWSPLEVHSEASFETLVVKIKPKYVHATRAKYYSVIRALRNTSYSIFISRGALAKDEDSTMILGAQIFQRFPAGTQQLSNKVKLQQYKNKIVVA